MIRIEANNYPFEITNDQFKKISLIVALDWSLNYDVVEGDTDGLVWLWVHPFDEAFNPTRHWIDVDGNVSLTEEVTWDWKE